jgi:hypothetical protein
VGPARHTPQAAAAAAADAPLAARPLVRVAPAAAAVPVSMGAASI